VIVESLDQYNKCIKEYGMDVSQMVFEQKTPSIKFNSDADYYKQIEYLNLLPTAFTSGMSIVVEADETFDDFMDIVETTCKNGEVVKVILKLPNLDIEDLSE